MPRLPPDSQHKAGPAGIMVCTAISPEIPAQGTQAMGMLYAWVMVRMAAFVSSSGTHGYLPRRSVPVTVGVNGMNRYPKTSHLNLHDTRWFVIIDHGTHSGWR